MDINNCCFSGNLTRNPKLKFIPSGTAVTENRIAITEYRKGLGDKAYDVSFVPIALYGLSAEHFVRRLRKGAFVTVQGALRQDSWTSSKGQYKERVFCIVNRWSVDKSYFQQGVDTSAPSSGVMLDTEMPATADRLVTPMDDVPE